MTSISSSYNHNNSLRKVNNSGSNNNNNNNSNNRNNSNIATGENDNAYTQDELDSLRREGEHLLRVGGEQVARERSNTSPMVYPGDSDADDDISYSNSNKKKSHSDSDSDDDNVTNNNSNTGEAQYTQSNSNATNDSNTIVIGPVLPPHRRSESGNSTSSTSSKSSSKKHKNKSEKRHRSTSDLSNNDDLLSSSSSSDDEEDDAGISLNPSDSNNIVDVNFDFVDFNESYFHMTRQLISNSAWASFGVSEITNAVIDQVAVGTVIKVDEAITGFITALNIDNSHIKHSSKEIQKFLLSSCPNKARMEQILSLNLSTHDKQSVGYLISERLVNLPSELSPALHRSFLDDVEWASGSTSGINDVLRKELSFKYLILFSTVYIMGGNSNSKKKKKKKKRSNKKQKTGNDNNGSSNNEQIYYVKFEDEILRDSATLSYTCPLRTSGIDTEPRSMGPFGVESCLVMVLEVGKLKGCVERLSLLVQQQQQ